jgi:chromosome condensin MukBEF ATPase and DNA-binding subunit MukB
MKTLRLTIASLFLVFAIQSIAVAQSTNITETFKKHFNETVQQVHQADDADEKRLILNESFSKMLIAIDRIESRVNLSEDEIVQLQSFKHGIEEKQNELNGLDGFDEVLDEDLDDFSNFSQDFMEQANRTITIGATTLLLIIIILLLL